MKSKTLEREYDEFESRLYQLRKKNEHVPNEHMRLLIKCLQRLKQEISLTDTSNRKGAGGDVRSLFLLDNYIHLCMYLFSSMIVIKLKNKSNSFVNE